MLIAGDIGGTKTNLALFEESTSDFSKYEHFHTFPSFEYPSLESILKLYLEEKGVKGNISSASFAIAGPVVNGVCRATNLPWVVDEKKIASELGIAKVHLINDLLANAKSVEIMPNEMLEPLYLPSTGFTESTRAIVSPGTGLGESAMIWDEQKYLAIASEGGHSDFAPANELQDELLKYLRDKFDHVSYERILSGPGFLNLFQFFVDAKKRKVPDWLETDLSKQNHAAVITENALKGTSELCLETLDLFIEILGQECSNVALKFLSIGGLYIGGGIAPKILSRLKGEFFLKGFFNKGRFNELLKKIAIYVILDDKASLKGAAAYAIKVES